MKERPNYNFSDNNSKKDMNQMGQVNQKRGKKQNYHKNTQNKNYMNIFDEMSNNEYNNQNFQNNKRNRQNNKKKNKKNNKETNNDYIYNENPNTENVQSKKEEYQEEQNNNNNLTGNNFIKQFKSNQNIYNNLNNTIGSSTTSNINTSSNSHISNVNLTPQGQKITTPMGYNLANSNSPQSQGASNIPQMSQGQIYINPKLLYNEKLLWIPNMLDNERKSFETLSEEGKNSIDNIKNQNNIMEQELYMNNTFNQIPQMNNNNMYNIQYNIHNQFNPNMNKINNMGYNIPTNQSFNPNFINQMNNYNMKRQNFDNNKGNRVYADPPMHQKFFQNRSPTKSISNNNIMNMNNLINPYYLNNAFKNPNQNNARMGIGNNMSLSSQAPKNTIPNFLQGENLSFEESQPQFMNPMINYNNNRYQYIDTKKFPFMNNFQNNNMNFSNNKNYINNNGYMYNNIGNNNIKKNQKLYNMNYQGNMPMNKVDDKINNLNKETNKLFSSNQLNNNFLLELNLKLGRNGMTKIKIRNLDDGWMKLNELKKKKLINDTCAKIIYDKIIKAFEIKNKIFDVELNKYTCKNLFELNLIKNFNKKKCEHGKKIKRNKSEKDYNTLNRKKLFLAKEGIDNVESLNISI